MRAWRSDQTTFIAELCRAVVARLDCGWRRGAAAIAPAVATALHSIGLPAGAAIDHSLANKTRTQLTAAPDVTALSPVVQCSVRSAVRSDAAMTSERRGVPRRKTLKGGKITFNKGFSVLDCMVRNLSTRGACLEFGAAPAGIPERFDLVISPERVTRLCKVVWRSPSRIGVSFV